jgi:hypothetical protein
MQEGFLASKVGSPHWKHSELVFEKKGLIPALQQLLADFLKKNANITDNTITGKLLD